MAAFLNDLLSLGVAGFRIDAAKHMSPTDLAAIRALVRGSFYDTQVRLGLLTSVSDFNLL
jgi:alpha-amylase